MENTVQNKPISIYSLFGTDREAEENGKWFDFGPEVKIKIRRFKSKHSTRVREAAEKPFERLRRDGVLPKEIMEEVLQKTLSESVVADWSGMFDMDGNPIPFSADNVDQVLKALPELRDAVTAHAISMDNFREEDDATTEGN